MGSNSPYVVVRLVPESPVDGATFATYLDGLSLQLMDAYLQPPSQDIEPIAGQLLLFPSWLAHQALPYQGDLERVIISFNFSVHGSQGDQIHDYSAT